MHGSIWHISGDPEVLTARYDALLAELPESEMALHLCLRSPDGLVVVDTCPSEEEFRSFIAGEWFAAALDRHGLPYPERVDDFPVHVAISGGTRAVG